MVQNGRKPQKKFFHKRGNERKVQASERESSVEQANEQCGASEQANGQISGPVIQSVFLAILDHSGIEHKSGKTN